MWHSDLFLDFIHRVTEKHGPQDGKTVQNKIFKKTTSLLQAKESKFRTYLMRHQSFRRVPRITFLPPGNELTREEIYDNKMKSWEREQKLKQKIEKRWLQDREREITEPFDGAT